MNVNVCGQNGLSEWRRQIAFVVENMIEEMKKIGTDPFGEESKHE